MRTAIRSDFLTYTLGHSHSYFQDNFAGALARKISEVAESTLRLHDIVRFQIWFAVVQMSVTLCFLFSVNIWCGPVSLLPLSSPSPRRSSYACPASASGPSATPKNAPMSPASSSICSAISRL